MSPKANDPKEGFEPAQADEAVQPGRQRLDDLSLSAEDRLCEIHRLLGCPETWPELNEEELSMVVDVGCVEYGRNAEESRTIPLDKLYRLCVDRLPCDVRMESLFRVSTVVEGRRTSARALLPFLFLEPDMGIICTASLNTAVLHPLVDEDPLTGPKALAEIVTRERDQWVRVGVLVGLLDLVDRRVLPLIFGCLEFLNTEERIQLTTACSGLAYVSTIELLLSWLEAETDDEVYGAVAAALAELPLIADPPMVRDIERKFPANAPDDRPVVAELQRWSIEDYAIIIEGRLRAIADKETEPRVIPMVLEAWGL